MKQFKWLFTFSVIFLTGLSGCKEADDENTIRYVDFPETVELKGTTIEIDTIIFRYPFRVRLTEDKDKIIVQDIHNRDYFYHLFTYPDFTYLSSFGKRGNGPEEMLSPENVRVLGKEVYILDSHNRKLRRMGFNLSGDSLLVENEISLDENLLFPLDFCGFDKNTWIVPDFTGESRWCKVDSTGLIIERGGFIPAKEKSDEISTTALSQAWRGFVDYNPEMQVLSIATQLGEVLEIYNFQDNTYKVVRGPNDEPEFKVSGGYAIPSGIMGYSDIFITNDYIYTVFHGRSFKDIMRETQRTTDGGRYIYVFDLKGNPVRKYVLDRYIYGIYVDENSGTIIATDINQDDPLVTFSLPMNG